MIVDGLAGGPGEGVIGRDNAQLAGAQLGDLPVRAGARQVDADDVVERAARGVARYASNTLSTLRRRWMQAFSAPVSPTSTTKRFFTIGCTTVQRASRMFTPDSANVRERSSSRRVRSQQSTWSSTRNDCAPSPSHSTSVKRSGLRISARTLGQSSRWIVMRLPSEM